MPTRPIATAIVKKLVDAGHIAYFAGGWVRDFLMQRPSDDIDIATSASVEEVQALFSKTIPVGVAFGIVIVVQDQHQFEVATFRKDRGYIDGRRPTGIDPATPEEDAQRRDFTINGMFYDPLSNQLLDYVNGQEDIKRKLIKAIGDPDERFLEDRLRMMRAVRYCTRFDFFIEAPTVEAIRSQAETLLPAVAIERIWQEFKKMSQFAHFDKGLIMLHELGLLQTIFPELKQVSVEEISQRVQAIERFPKTAPTISELLELFPSSSLQKKLDLCDYLKLSREDREFARFLHHSQEILKAAHVKPLAWAQFYAHPHAEVCLQIAAAHLAESTAFLAQHQLRQEQLAWAITRIRTKNPVVCAEDLIKEGVPPGKNLGLLLEEAERISVNEGIDDREAIIKHLKHSPLWRFS